MIRKCLMLMTSIVLPIWVLFALLMVTKPLHASQHSFPGCGATIQECIDNAQPGDTIVIAAGSYTESLKLTKSVSLTGVSSATAIIRANPNQRVLTVNGSAINSSTIISGLTFSGGNVSGGTACPAYCGGGILITGTAHPLLQDLTIRGNQAYRGGGIYADAATPLRLVNAALISNTAEISGGGVWAEGPVLVTNGRFEHNWSQFGGGGLYAEGTAAVTGTTFFSNTSLVGAGGGVVSDTASFVDGRFENNKGGGLKAHSTLSLFGMTFIGNHSWIGGAAATGAVTVTDSYFGRNFGRGLYTASTLYMTGTTVISNGHIASGGGAYAVGPATIISSHFECNNCMGFLWDTGFSGGGLYAGGTLVMTGSTFIRNEAGQQGGGVYAAGKATVTNSHFESNSTMDDESDGGGLYALGSLDLIDSSFVKNTASFGGGVFTREPITVTNGRFERNKGYYFGGGLFAQSVTLSRTQFIYNVGGQGGGAFAFSGTAASAVFLGNTADEGGGLYMTDVDIKDSIFMDNWATTGGGLSADGIVNVLDSQFIDNQARLCAGAIEAEDLFITNSLLSGNAQLETSAWHCRATVRIGNQGQILHTTFADAYLNPGRAVRVDTGVLTVTNSIVTNFSVGITGLGTIKEDYNLFFNNGTDLEGTVLSGGNSLFADPDFKAPADGDFRLGPNSAALDNALDLGIVSDLDGNPRPLGKGPDRGAYEAIPYYLWFRQYLPLLMSQ